MNPLMYGGLLPDSRQVSSEAAARHAILAAGKERDSAYRPRLRTWHPVPQG